MVYLRSHFNIFIRVIALTVAFVTVAPKANADVLFEGYAKVLSGGVPIGFFISKYEFDTKKKQFVSTSFLKTNDMGGGITESLQAYATDDFKPISYSYTTLVGKTPKTIDAKFEKGKILATVRTGGKEEKIIKEIPKGTFLSTFLAYVILKSPQGLKPETKYEYQAIAEEEAALVKGVAVVKNKEKVLGLDAFRIANEFKGVQFISYVTEKGEVLSTKSPVQGISTEIVAKPDLATQNIQIPTSLIKKLFGDVPTGQKNAVSQLNHLDDKATSSSQTNEKKLEFAPIEHAPDATKQRGVAPGKGLHLKKQESSQSGKQDDKSDRSQTEKQEN